MPVVHIQFLYSKAKGLKEINIYFKSHSMEHQETVQYLSHLTINWLEKWWSQKAKIIAKLKFMYQPSRYQTPVFRILLCNVLIEPHFGYGFSLWFFLFLFFFFNWKSNFRKFKICLFLRRFNSQIWYQSIAIEKNKLASNSLLRILVLSTRMEFYWDIFTKCLSLHSADIAHDQRWHCTPMCGKQI